MTFVRNERMRKLRGNRTQKKVAEDLGISQRTYAMYELGYRFPRRDMQEKLAKYFCVTVDYLFFGRDDHVS